MYCGIRIFLKFLRIECAESDLEVRTNSGIRSSCADVTKSALHRIDVPPSVMKRTQMLAVNTER